MKTPSEIIERTALLPDNEAWHAIHAHVLFWPRPLRHEMRNKLWDARNTLKAAQVRQNANSGPPSAAFIKQHFTDINIAEVIRRLAAITLEIDEGRVTDYINAVLNYIWVEKRHFPTVRRAVWQERRDLVARKNQDAKAAKQANRLAERISAREHNNQRSRQARR